MNGFTGSPFRGRFDLKLDAKGRLGLPSAYRQVITADAAGAPSAKRETQLSLVMTNGRYRNRSCLDVYTLHEWEKLERRVSRLSSLKPEVQAFTRFYLSGGQPVEVDAQSRMLVPQVLRRYAGLESQAVLVGLGGKFEIWAADVWRDVFEQLTDSFEETIAAVAALEPGE